MFISKTRESAKVFSREAGAISFDQTNISKTTIGGTDPIGSASIEQLELGVSFPNTQSAIADISNSFQHQINEVITVAELAGTAAIAPGGVSMVMRLTIDGNSTNNGIIKVFGIPVPVTQNMNRAAITDKVIEELNKYKDDKIAFRSVSKLSGNDNKIDVTFIDTLEHQLIRIEDNGITITSEESTPARGGYGQWQYLGSNTIGTPAVSGAPVTILKYYKRIA